MRTSVADEGRPFIQNGEMYRAGRPALGARLLAAAEMVRCGAVVADIGCDHGKLAVYLAMGGAPKVVAVDSRPMPLARARTLAAQTACGDVVECVLGSGLAPLAGKGVTDIVVAGLSGVTIADMLANSPLARDEAVRLILVPASRGPFLRRWLCENGFALQKEVPVLENARAYTVMQAAYTGEVHTPTALFCEMGLLCGQGGAAARAYAAARLRGIAGRAKGPLSPTEKQNLKKLAAEVETCLL